MIITGGENVYTLEVERALMACKGVVAAMVVGRPDAVWGESVHAVVVSQFPEADGGERLRQELRDHLAGYKIPRTVEFVDQLELSGSLKPMKRRPTSWKPTTP
jgi:acyl-CoA synthetase (AMP-forming)/AMP-acid ligase II